MKGPKKRANTFTVARIVKVMALPSHVVVGAMGAAKNIAGAGKAIADMHACGVDMEKMDVKVCCCD